MCTVTSSSVLIIFVISCAIVPHTSLEEARLERQRLVQKYIKTLNKEEGAIRLVGGRNEYEGSTNNRHHGRDTRSFCTQKPYFHPKGTWKLHSMGVLKTYELELHVVHVSLTAIKRQPIEGLTVSRVELKGYEQKFNLK
uniref:Uncharacterized protein n=1 Tax=Glossina austeni TaxID=7395 RepID=A0A1A9VEF4_GLOAU